MDPALWRLLEERDSQDEVPVILRLTHPGVVPPGVRLVAQFGEIATVRLKRGSIYDVRERAEVISAKAARPILPDEEPEPDGIIEPATQILPSDERRPRSLDVTGRGVVVGIVDFGLDFVHPDFRNPDGSTRVLVLWDQRPPQNSKSPEPYRYGVVHTKEDINRALHAEDPYAVLSYHPADSDPEGLGTHGTHVASIAVGNGRSGGLAGIAPEADLIFVHLSAWDSLGLAKIGDSVTLLEAVDFIVKNAVNQPIIIHTSLGRCAGSHDGLTHVEQAFDYLVRAAPNRAICQSAGNYFNRRIHTSGQLRPGETRTLIWEVEPADVTPNEMEIWYPGRDKLNVNVASPDGSFSQKIAQNENAAIIISGKEVGHVYHRTSEPNNLDNVIHIFLDIRGPKGEWQVTLNGLDVVDGHYDAWIERDAARPHSQSRFRDEDAISFSTTNTICNGLRTIAVGAYNAHSTEWSLAPFSSAGPTRDHRIKPDLIAPGVRVLAARSAPPHPNSASSLLVRKSGTSMAAPHVSGCIALMFEATRRPLRIEETRNILLANCRRVTGPSELQYRVGSGYLDIERAVKATRKVKSTIPEVQEKIMMDEETGMVSEISIQEDGEKVLLTDMIDSEEFQGEEEEVLSEPALVQAKIGKDQFNVSLESTAKKQTFTSLDEAVEYALRQIPEISVVFGTITGNNFTVVRGSHSQPIPSPLPPIVSVIASREIAVLAVTNERVFFSSNPVSPANRLVAIPRLKDFYNLPIADRIAYRNGWIDKINKAGMGYTRDTLKTLSMPALQLLFAHFASKTIPVKNVSQQSFKGAVSRGVTIPLLRFPITEPECYLTVIAHAEGMLESINAYDLGAGISIGPVQFNVQRGALFRFLWQIWEADPDLFNQEFGTSLGWSMQSDEDHYDLVIQKGQSQQYILHGRDTKVDVNRNCGYFQSGTPGQDSFNQIDQAFRRTLTGHLRNLVVWPHIQEIIMETSSWWLTTAMEILHSNGIPTLDSRNPDRDTFILKSMLLFLFMRFSGYLKPLVNEMKKWKNISDKLANWENVLNDITVNKEGHREILRTRLQKQYHDAENVYRTIAALMTGTLFHSGESKLFFEETKNVSINACLPASGPGFYSSSSASRRFGRSETIQAVVAIGKSWETAHSSGPRIGIGDISFEGGGQMPPHSSHKEGLDIDIRPMRTDGVEGPTDFQSKNYNRALTQELVNQIRSNNILKIQYIFFNDPEITGVNAWPSHNNHLHVRFLPPDEPSKQSELEAHEMGLQTLGLSKEDLDSFGHIEKAVQFNRYYAQTLGWQEYFGRIIKILGLSGSVPNEEDLVQAVFRWQELRDLLPDGIIGPKTWEQMRLTLWSPHPSPVSVETIEGGDVLQGPFGILRVTGTPFTYIFTEEDVRWTARLLVGESGGEDTMDSRAVFWAMINRYALLTNLNYPSFHLFIRSYSITLQPVLKNFIAAKRYMNRPDFIRTGGYYPNTNIPKGNLERHLTLQRTPWSELQKTARSLAERCLKGQVPNPGIGNATDFASTYSIFHGNYGRYPKDKDEWSRFTEQYGMKKGLIWIGPVTGLNQYERNAFFILRETRGLPENVVRITYGEEVLELISEDANKYKNSRKNFI